MPVFSYGAYLIMSLWRWSLYRAILLTLPKVVGAGSSKGETFLHEHIQVPCLFCHYREGGTKSKQYQYGLPDPEVSGTLPPAYRPPATRLVHCDIK